MKAFKIMLKTEFKLALRGMDMVIFGICMPVVVMVLLGIIYGNKPAFDGAGTTFLAQSFSAAASIGVCAAGVMGLPLVLADYRHKKILKRFQVTPVSPALLLIVQVTIHTLFAVLSLLFVYLVAAIFFGYRMAGAWLPFAGAYIFVLLSIFSIGVMVAGIAPNIKTAQLLCTILYFPMLIFSGATLPYEVMPAALQKAADILPLTQGIKLLKAASLGLPMDTAAVSIIVIAVITVICVGVSLRFFRWE